MKAQRFGDAYAFALRNLGGLCVAFFHEAEAAKVGC